MLVTSIRTAHPVNVTGTEMKTRQSLSLEISPTLCITPVLDIPCIKQMLPPFLSTLHLVPWSFLSPSNFPIISLRWLSLSSPSVAHYLSWIFTVFCGYCLRQRVPHNCQRFFKMAIARKSSFFYCEVCWLQDLLILVILFTYHS